MISILLYLPTSVKVIKSMNKEYFQDRDEVDTAGYELTVNDSCLVCTLAFST